MLFGRQMVAKNTEDRLAEKIERELIATLGKKGIKISKIHIDMKTGSLNVEMDFKDKRAQ